MQMPHSVPWFAQNVKQRSGCTCHLTTPFICDWVGTAAVGASCEIAWGGHASAQRRQVVSQNWRTPKLFGLSWTSGRSVWMRPMRTRGPKSKRSPQEDEIQRLRRENQRLAEELRKAEIVIDVQKKVGALLGWPLPKADPEEKP